MRAAGIVVSLDDQLMALRTIRDSYGYGQRSRAEAALGILATGWVAYLRYAPGMQRDIALQHAKAELRGLMEQALDIAIHHMAADVAKLIPYFWNVFASDRRAILMQTDREIVEVGNRAREEIRNPGSFRELRGNSGGAGVEYREGQAMRQLKEIDRSKIWRNQ